MTAPVMRVTVGAARDGGSRTPAVMTAHNGDTRPNSARSAEAVEAARRCRCGLCRERGAASTSGAIQNNPTAAPQSPAPT
jgi:hypothetical protein